MAVVCLLTFCFVVVVVVAGGFWGVERGAESFFCLAGIGDYSQPTLLCCNDTETNECMACEEQESL